MKKREQFVEVMKAELRPSKNMSSERVDWVTVTLNTGHSFSCRPDEAPRVGDRLVMTLCADDSLDVVRPLADRILDAATQRVPNDRAGASL